MSVQLSERAGGASGRLADLVVHVVQVEKGNHSGLVRSNAIAYRGLVCERAVDVTERNAMFVHLLVWDRRYTGGFFKDLLTGLFDVTSYLQHVILVIPPRIILSELKDRSHGERRRSR